MADVVWKTNNKDEAKVREAARYYDVANFASRIPLPSWLRDWAH